MTDHQQLLAPQNDKAQEPEEEDSQKEEVEKFDYRVPAIPAYTANILNHLFLVTTPYWIAEFIIYCVKGRMIRKGVLPVDWFILFFWLISNTLATTFGISSIRRSKCGYKIVLYLLCAILCVFFTIYIVSLSSTILLVEFILSIVMLIVQILTLIATIISFLIQLTPQKAKSA